MDSSLNDKRFAHIGKDPRFRRVPESTRKVVVDKRFNSMFSDKRFKLKYTVDKRGKPISLTSNEQLKKFYELESDESDEEAEDADQKTEEDDQDDDESEEEPEESSDEEDDSPKQLKELEHKDSSKGKKIPEITKPTITTKNGTVNGFVVSEIQPKNKQPKVELSEEVKAKLQDMDVDYARGEDVLFSDSSSSEEESSDEEEEPEVFHDWGELDKDAGETDSPTYRLAVCNMDWDRIRAVDILVVLQSFAPQGLIICFPFKHVRLIILEYPHLFI